MTKFRNLRLVLLTLAFLGALIVSQVAYVAPAEAATGTINVTSNITASWTLSPNGGQAYQTTYKSHSVNYARTSTTYFTVTPGDISGYTAVCSPSCTVAIASSYDTKEVNIFYSTNNAPFISFSANPQQIGPGESSTLSWSASSADICYHPVTGAGTGVSGSATVSPSKSTTYSVSCTDYFSPDPNSDCNEGIPSNPSNCQSTSVSESVRVETLASPDDLPTVSISDVSPFKLGNEIEPGDSMSIGAAFHWEGATNSASYYIRITRPDNTETMLVSQSYCYNAVPGCSPTDGSGDYTYFTVHNEFDKEGQYTVRYFITAKNATGQSVESAITKTITVEPPTVDPPTCPDENNPECDGTALIRMAGQNWCIDPIDECGESTSSGWTEYIVSPGSSTTYTVSTEGVPGWMYTIDYTFCDEGVCPQGRIRITHAPLVIALDEDDILEATIVFWPNVPPPDSVAGISVNSSGATGVSITSASGPSGVFGTTNYYREYDAGFLAELVAPPTADGKSFVSWSGCEPATGNSCFIDVSLGEAESVTANYDEEVVPPDCPDENNPECEVVPPDCPDVNNPECDENPGDFDYSLSNTNALTIDKSSSSSVGQKVITKSLTAGATQSVSITATGMPSGVSIGYINRDCSPTCNSTIEFNVAPSTAIGTYPITVTATPGNKTLVFNLVITGSAMNVSCVPSPTTAVIGQSVTWTASATGGTEPYTYSWSGSGIPTAPAPSANPYTLTYSTIGPKNAIVLVTDASDETASCPAGSSVQVNFNPSFEEF